MSLNTFDALDGALLIDKPAGPTSHDIVDIVRRSYRIKKVGHCGTLDPAATGLLTLLLGKALIVQMTMAVGKPHAAGSSASSTTSRGNMGVGGAILNPVAFCRSYQPSSSAPWCPSQSRGSLHTQLLQVQVCPQVHSIQQ